VLPRSARLTRPEDFARTTKSGLRVTSKSLVGYLYPTFSSDPARCGLIINKSVAGSVGRHKLARQIRHGLSNYLPQLPLGSLVVIRVLPNAEKKNLYTDLEKVVTSLIERSMAQA